MTKNGDLPTGMFVSPGLLATHLIREKGCTAAEVDVKNGLMPCGPAQAETAAVVNPASLHADNVSSQVEWIIHAPAHAVSFLRSCSQIRNEELSGLLSDS